MMMVKLPKNLQEKFIETIIGLSLKYPKYKGVAMGQPEFTASEARLLEKLQEKKSLTGWPREIAKIVKVELRGLDYARNKLGGYGFISEERMTSETGDGTQVIKLSITDAGMQVVPIADGKGSERVNDDIKNLIANMGYTQKEIAEELGVHTSTFKGQLNKSMSYEKRNKLINKIKQLCR